MYIFVMDARETSNKSILNAIHEKDGEGGGSREKVKRGHQDEILMGNVPRRIDASREGVT